MPQLLDDVKYHTMSFGTFAEEVDDGSCIDVHASTIEMQNEREKLLFKATNNAEAANISSLSIESKDAKQSLNFWYPSLTFKQLSTRDRESAFYSVDAFRALAFFWVQNLHVQDGLEVVFNSDEFLHWQKSVTIKAFGATAANGVTVFFVISGFLNFYVLLRISEKFKEKNVSMKSIRNYIFRRYMHLAPNLYISIGIFMIFGWLSTLESVKGEFLDPCISGWWYDVLFLESLLPRSLHSCYDSTWSISSEFQLYLLGLPVVIMYSYSKILTTLFIVSAVVIIFNLRWFLSFDYPSISYTASFTRGDAYFLGMGLYFVYDTVLKPIRTRSYTSVQYQEVSLDEVDSVNLDVEIGTLSLNDALKKYVFVPMKLNYLRSIKSISFFHQNAPISLVLTYWLLFPICFLLCTISVIDVLYQPSWFWFKYLSFYDVTNSTRIYTYFVSSYQMLSAACGTISFMYLSLEGTVFPLTWLLTQFIWYPIGNVTYTCYLMSIPTIKIASFYILQFNGSALTWRGNFYEYFKYYWYYTLFNMVFGVALTFLVERPMMNLSKIIEL